MFEQIHSAFTAGMSTLPAQLQAPIAQALAPASAQYEKTIEASTARIEAAAQKACAAINETARAAAREPRQGGANKQAARDGGVTAPAPVPAPAPASRSGRDQPPPPRESSQAQTAGASAGAANGIVADFATMMELRQCVSELQYEKAFALALQTGNIETTQWLCSQLEPRVLKGPPPISQIILMSLIAVLASDLTTETKLKLAWIKGALAQTNPHDPLIAPNAGRILLTVVERLKEVPTQVEDEFAAEISMLKFMLQKLLA